MGGASEFILPILKTILKQHNGPGHVLDVKDPFMLLDGVNEMPMVS